MLEALRAVRETSTNLGGIKAFRKQVLTDGPMFLKLYLERSPAFEEIRSIWDYQQKVRSLCEHAAIGSTTAGPPATLQFPEDIESGTSVLVTIYLVPLTEAL